MDFQYQLKKNKHIKAARLLEIITCLKVSEKERKKIFSSLSLLQTLNEPTQPFNMEVPTYQDKYYNENGIFCPFNQISTIAFKGSVTP